MFAANQGLMFALGGIAWALFGFVILVILKCLPPGEKPSPGNFGRLVFAVLGWLFVAAGLILAVSSIGVVAVEDRQRHMAPWRQDPGKEGALVVIGLSVLPVVLLFIVVGLVFARRRRARQQALLWTLAVATERSIPLTGAVEAFAEERSRLGGYEVRILARLLKAGTPLPQALAIVGGMVPEEAVVPIQVGQDLGALDEGLRQATAPAGPYQSVWDQLAGKVAYVCFLVVFAASMTAYMLIEIVPKFQHIFQEFGSKLPEISRIVMDVSGRFRVVIALGAVFLLWLLVYAVLRCIGTISWDLPLMGRLARRLHAARVLESLAMAVERNQPLFKTVATLARCYPKPSIRRRLQVVLVDVTSGVDFAESLRSQGLISRADLAVLHAAQRVGNLAWAMREIADSNRRRLAYRVQAWLQILFPAAIISFGLMVLLLVAGYFLPLVSLIQKLA